MNESNENRNANLEEINETETISNNTEVEQYIERYIESLGFKRKE